MFGFLIVRTIATALANTIWKPDNLSKWLPFWSVFKWLGLKLQPDHWKTDTKYSIFKCSWCQDPFCNEQFWNSKGKIDFTCHSILRWHFNSSKVTNNRFQNGRRQFNFNFCSVLLLDAFPKFLQSGMNESVKVLKQSMITLQEMAVLNGFLC